jgi:hypothetical protein
MSDYQFKIVKKHFMEIARSALAVMTLFAADANAGRVIVIEWLLGKTGEPGLAPLIDLNVMVVLTGRERTLAEYCGLLKEAGLRFSKSTPIRSQIAVIEAVPA